MRFRRLRISNFKAITGIDLDNLSDVVVVAGPNGCGKSCVFDAIRLLKSAYGGYQPNEVDRWFGEFQIEIKQGERDLLALFQDKKKPVHIRVEIELSTAEREYLKRNARRLVQAQAWGAIVPQTPVPYASGGTPLA